MLISQAKILMAREAHSHLSHSFFFQEWSVTEWQLLSNCIFPPFSLLDWSWALFHSTFLYTSWGQNEVWLLLLKVPISACPFLCLADQNEVWNSHLPPSPSSLSWFQSFKQGPTAPVSELPPLSSSVCPSLFTYRYFNMMSGCFSCVCVMHRKSFVDL